MTVLYPNLCYKWTVLYICIFILSSKNDNDLNHSLGEIISIKSLSLTGVKSQKFRIIKTDYQAELLLIHLNCPNEGSGGPF